MLVKDVMKKDLVTVRRSTMLRELIHRLQDFHTFPLVPVVEEDNRYAGLLIDELLGKQQIVIKSLGDMMKNIAGVSGGAIMPDGRVGLILDIGGIIDFAHKNYGYKET